MSLFQNKYYVTEDNWSFKKAEDVKVGDKLKSWDTENRQFIDVTVTELVPAVLKPACIIITYENSCSFVLAKGFSIWEDGQENFVARHPDISSKDYGNTAGPWSPDLPIVTATHSEAFTAELLFLDDCQEDTSQDAYWMINFKISGGDNIFLTPDPQRLRPICLGL